MCFHDRNLLSNVSSFAKELIIYMEFISFNIYLNFVILNFGSTLKSWSTNFSVCFHWKMKQVKRRQQPGVLKMLPLESQCYITSNNFSSTSRSGITHPTQKLSKTGLKSLFFHNSFGIFCSSSAFFFLTDHAYHLQSKLYNNLYVIIILDCNHSLHYLEWPLQEHIGQYLTFLVVHI